tara:strand:- start:6 stop:2801 length:2796 start_codon:yes stop_codon:yes gene_type:complete
VVGVHEEVSSFSSLTMMMMRFLVVVASIVHVQLVVTFNNCGAALADAEIKCPETQAQFQTLSPITQPSPIEQMEWLARYDASNKDDHTKKTERVIAKLTNGQIYQSKDNGKTFADETAVLRGFQEDKEFTVDRILVPRDDLYTKRVILQGNKDRHWASKDLGDSWIQPCGFESANEANNCFKSPTGGRYDQGYRIVGSMVMHPGEHRDGHVLALVSRPECERTYYDDTVVCAKDLMLTTDFGQTEWRNLTDSSDNDIVSFVDFDWGPDPDPTHSEASILATVYTSKEDLWKSRHHPGFSFAVTFIRSSSFFVGKDWYAHKTPCGNIFEVLNNDVYVAALKDCDKYLRMLEDSKDITEDEENDLRYDHVQLEVSTDSGETFNPICFPENIRAKSFTIFDFDAVQKGPDFISIDHAEEETSAIEGAAPMGNLYAADDSLRLFSLSLRRNVRERGVADFSGIASMNGVFIANQISTEAFKGRYNYKDVDYSQYYQTLQSFNGGGVWRYIPAPKKDANGNDIQGCTITDDPKTVCSLHLHGESAWSGGENWKTRFGAVYSHQSTPGVIISTGNVGNVLSKEASEVNTYISRDGGYTWEEALQGPHIYEFGNFGALIVAAKESSVGQTDEVWFSRDVGKCWEGPIKLSKPINVHNIRTDVVQKGSVFVIHGEDATKSESYQASGIAYVIDFDNLLLSNSTFRVDKCDEKNDYETWFLNIPNQKECNMGEKVERRRRKRYARCLNLEDGVVSELHDTVSQSHVCDCEHMYDTSCEYGYYRVHSSPSAISGCDPMPNVNIDECTYLIDKGSIPKSHERIVHGDVCNNPLNAIGADYDDLGRKRRKRHHTKHPVFGFFLFCVFGGAFYVAYKYFDLGRFLPSGFRDAVNEFFENVMDWLRRVRNNERGGGLGRFGGGGGGGSRPDGYFEPLADFDEDEI